MEGFQNLLTEQWNIVKLEARNENISVFNRLKIEKCYNSIHEIEEICRLEI